jgi:hydroxymethylpyrimidine pyrophosphatase-like HAD family hydrolase
VRDFDAVLCDIDGCLVDEGSGPLDLARLDEVARWNRRACAHGDRPVVTLCSGRPQPFAEAMCRLVANSRLACIAENGVWLYDPGTNRYAIEPRITPADVALVRDAEAWVRDALGPLGVSIQPGKTASISSP